MKRAIMTVGLFITLAFLLVGCTEKNVDPQSKNSGMTVKMSAITANPEVYVNQKIELEGYALNVRAVCRASTMECWGKVIFSQNELPESQELSYEEEWKTTIQLYSSDGEAYGYCDYGKPCHGLVHNQKYKLKGMLKETNPKNNYLSKYGFYVDSFEED
ncbi:hypothetical protein HYT55_02670 [Candidatus Woesearchaeota archaeon]|nr:hypothetical protein [Candidatus Woesearchaeota archaeon]